MLEMLSWMNIVFFKYVLRFMVSEIIYETGLWSLLVFWFVLLTGWLVVRVVSVKAYFIAYAVLGRAVFADEAN